MYGSIQKVVVVALESILATDIGKIGLFLTVG